MKSDAEGTNRRWRRRILFHEAGHALDTAFGLRRRGDWRAVFGRASKNYPSAYSVRPASRRFVQHLGHWYAQSHPTEDFAETFAVWLQPRARWQREYAGWPALDKLLYVDELMAEVANSRPRNRDRSIVAPLAENRRTLKEHYRRHLPVDDLTERRYDAWLRRAFAQRAARPKARSASAFLGRAEGRIKQAVVRGIGPQTYLFEHVSGTLRRRCRALDLVLRTKQQVAIQTSARLYIRVIEDLLRRNSERYVL